MKSAPVHFIREVEIRPQVVETFEELRKTLAGALPDARIEHVGATAVPGALTKGDLDVCIQVERGAFSSADQFLAALFNRNTESGRTASFSSFTDDAREVPVGVQLVLAGSREDVFIRWRELLRRSPELLAAYNALKSNWHGRSHAEYRAEKGRFIEAALAQTAGTTLE
ncbi:MAG: GrpB family protein [Myxococcales bacterium]